MLVDVSSDGETYVLSFNQSSLIVKNWQTNQSHTIQTNINFMGGDISPDGTKIILVQQDQWSGPIFDLESGNEITTMTGFETAAPVYNISFGEDGNHAIWNARATIRLSDIATNTIGDPIFHEDFLSSFSLSPDGENLATSSLGTNNDAIIPLVFFYDAVTTEELARVEITSPAFSMDFSPDSKLLSIADGNNVAILDPIEFIELFRFEGDPERVNSLEFSPIGDVLAICGANQTVTFWTIPIP
jgi:WD40 repeat protein